LPDSRDAVRVDDQPLDEPAVPLPIEFDRAVQVIVRSGLDAARASAEWLPEPGVELLARNVTEAILAIAAWRGTPAHGTCGYRWALDDPGDEDRRELNTHACIDIPGHAMEHRCGCGATYPG
jgi:hypothetical protein